MRANVPNQRADGRSPTLKIAPAVVLWLCCGCATPRMPGLPAAIGPMAADGPIVRSQEPAEGVPAEPAPTAIEALPPEDREAIPPVPDPGVSAPVIPPPRPAIDAPGLQGLSPAERARLAYAPPSAGEEDEVEFPRLHDDPLKNSGIPPHERDPFLFPALMNLIHEDRWLLAENPALGLARRQRRWSVVDIRDPAPDTANFPNGPYTLPKGRAYVENSPLGLYGQSRNGGQSAIYQWDYLLRYGLTDNLEFRLFSNGITYQDGQGPRQPAQFGYAPLAFDFKMNFWEENLRYHVPALGIEVYIQTELGSPAFNAGTQPSMNLLLSQSLPFELGLEYNFGISGVRNAAGQTTYQFSAQWSLEREVVEDFDVFFHGFYNAAALPRLIRFQSVAAAEVPEVMVLGVGAIWSINDRVAAFGSYNFGLTDAAPETIALTGFAIAF
ncbi:transporter [Tautonia sociabilis]|uniref:Uncharacterized protein n=1 Tax=Tautonia sociabilis TaxID=2080755 RepID=A0A432MEK2_9BACT|nr:transporter [Tautonia sociabilis]RUL83949.1 hypothetical protein TsocGM_21240 [Tautonia sociabilis]